VTLTDRISAVSAPTPIEAEAQTFRNTKEVITYLRLTGWDVPEKASKVYDDVKKKRLRKKDGVFRQSDVDAYAKFYLAEAATGRKADDRVTAADEKKRIHDASRAEALAIQAWQQVEKERGRTIDRDECEIQKVGIIITLRSSLEAWARSHAGEGIETVQGDQSRVPEFIAFIDGGIREAFSVLSLHEEIVIDLEKDGPVAEVCSTC
jgi:hypothetical protein